MIHFLRTIFAPYFCISCHVFLDYDFILCEGCERLIRSIVSRAIDLTATKKMIVHAVGAYDQPLVSLLLSKSFGNRTIARQLGKLVWKKSIVAHLDFDYIVPIPLHWTRYAWRGYNQAHEIAKVLSEQTGKPIIHVIKRVRRTRYQSLCKGNDRYANVALAFALHNPNEYKLKGKRILLIDDVMTSGATLKQAAQVLLPLHCEYIMAVVVARAI